MTWNGGSADGTAGVTACPSLTARAGALEKASAKPPEGTNPDAGKTVPKGATAGGLAGTTLTEGDRSIAIHDAVHGGILRIERTISLPAGRVQPTEYPRFAAFARQADDALSRAIQIRLP